MSVTDARQRRRQAPRRPVHEAARGPAHDHGPRQLHRRHGPPRDAAHGRRPLARGPRQHHLDRRRGGQGHARRGGRVHPRGPGRRDPRRRCPWPGIPRAWRSRCPSTGRVKKGQVKHVGDPIAVVLAETKGQAMDGADLVIADLDPKPAVVDPEKALEDGSPLVWEEFGTNATHQWAVSGGDFAAAEAEAEVVVSQRVPNHRISGAPIEPRGSVGEARGESVTLYSATQIPHIARFLLAGDPGACPRTRSAWSRPTWAAASGPSSSSTARRCSSWPRQEAQPAGQVRGDALGAHVQLPPRARPDRHGHAHGQERRHGHGLQGRGHRRHRRLPPAAHAVHRGAGLPGGGRLLQVPRHRLQRHGRLHQQDADRRHPRRRAGPRPRTGSS